MARVAMVLGGGGAKCIAHTGAWQAVEEWGGEVTHVLGTSMGAVIGAALAAGVTPNGIVDPVGPGVTGEGRRRRSTFWLS